MPCFIQQMMFCKISLFKNATILGLIWAGGVYSVLGAGLKALHNHVPAVTSKLATVGDLPATNELRLAIGLPLRDATGLVKFLKEVYDSASPNFHHYLTPTEFTARFGPTVQDYAAVKAFAQANGFVITSTHGNRLLLDVRANVADIQRAFHLGLRRFKHPSETRDFFAPDREPTVDFALPIADVSGLNNYKLPKPKLVKKTSGAGNALAKSGSAPTGDFLGDDFRAAYVPDTTLTGAGQVVGLMQFDGFYAKDILNYARAAGGGRTNIPIQTVLLDNYDGKPRSGNDEVALDIQMAMAMAPGLTKIIIFTGGPAGQQNDILNVMAASNTVKNLSCSWGWPDGPNATTDAIFQQMAAQGQSFFNASGDSDAFTTGASSVNGVDNPAIQNAPSSSPYIIQVGGTTLQTTGPGGAWRSESVWNWGGGSGSSGGISSYYSIPDWQVGVNMANNLGSTTQRNIPDVALTADNVYSYSDNGVAGSVGGTSCAAPLWAGLTALANQQAELVGSPSVGFINPTVYALGVGANYTDNFHDITDGDNTWSSSASQFYAVTGYDLCTGWGTPIGQGLIDALVGQGISKTNTLQIVSAPQLAASGGMGGPFNPADTIITLTNIGESPLTWSLLNPTTVTWLQVYPTGGELNPQTATNLTVNITAAATNLAAGNYSADLSFASSNSIVIQHVTFQLQVLPPLSVQPANGFTATGPVGGPFFSATQDFTFLNLSGATAAWKISKPVAWLTFSPASGTVAAGSQSNFTASVNAKANKLKAGVYKSTVTVRNSKNKIIQSLPFTLNIGQNLVVNGGFETGNFSGWIMDAASTQVGNRTGLVHAGRYGAQLGQTNTLGELSQNLPTIAGQTYLLSFWLTNPNNALGATPNAFQVQWEGETIYHAENLPFQKWTNLQFTVTATNSGSRLEFDFQDDPYYLGLDDVSVKLVVLAAAPSLRSIVQNPTTFNFSFVTTPGATYQAQYKTNLAQPNWINLGGPTFSETNVLQFSDPDTADYPQKFYRLLLVN
jgi:hypothetical protein